MWTAEVEPRWQQLATEVFSGIKEWRVQHPKATLSEIEVALDERWASARARLLQDLALASTATDLRTLPLADRPRCPDCDQPLEARGQKVRQVTTSHNQPLTLTRTAARCPACGAGLFPPG